MSPSRRAPRGPCRRVSRRCPGRRSRRPGGQPRGFCSGGKYLSSKSPSFRRVAGGEGLGFVITAFRRRPGHSHSRGGAIGGITRRSTSLAVATLFRRVRETGSTHTVSGGVG